MVLAYGSSSVTLNEKIFSKYNVISPPREQKGVFPEEYLPDIREKLFRKVSETKPETVSIVAEDKTRVNPEYPAILKLIIDVLKSSGVRSIFLVPAYGTHPPHSPAEHQSLYGKENLQNLTLTEHNCFDETELREVGTLSSGRKLKINGTAAQSDFLITLGSVAPHAFAGFTGGPKIILPGISDYESIRANHSQVIHPMADLCMLRGNPVHEGMKDALNLVKVDFAFQSVRSSSGKLAGLFYGDLQDSYHKAIECCSIVNGVSLKSRADLVIASCGGKPYDNNLYSAQRCIAVAAKAVKRGGQVLIVGEFSNRIGNETLAQCLKEKNLFRKVKPEQIQVGMHSALLMLKNMACSHTTFHSSWDADFGRDYGLDTISGHDQLEQFLKSQSSKDPLVYIIPETSNILINLESDTE